MHTNSVLLFLHAFVVKFCSCTHCLVRNSQREACGFLFRAYSFSTFLWTCPISQVSGILVCHLHPFFVLGVSSLYSLPIALTLIVLQKNDPWGVLCFSKSFLDITASSYCCLPLPLPLSSQPTAIWFLLSPLEWNFHFYYFAVWKFPCQNCTFVGYHMMFPTCICSVIFNSY